MSTGFKAFAIVIALLVGFVVLLVIFVPLPDTASSTVQTAARTVAPPQRKEKYCIMPGEICRLADAHVFNKDTQWIPTAISLEAYEELHKAIIAGDMRGVLGLVASGEVLHTQVGDGIRILDVSVFNLRTEGRMTSGKYEGVKVWITAAWAIP